MAVGIYPRTKEQYLSRTGENHFRWKGNKVGYRALHEWIEGKLGKAKNCESCGISKKPRDKKRWFEWSCKDGAYSRNLKSWWSLCVPCHRKFDNWHEKITKA